MRVQTFFFSYNYIYQHTFFLTITTLSFFVYNYNSKYRTNNCILELTSNLLWYTLELILQLLVIKIINYHNKTLIMCQYD